MSEITKQYAVDIERVAATHYRATNAAGHSIEFGSGDGLFSPVELLLAAVGGCASVDVDVVTGRRADPEEFTVRVEADRVDESGASRLSDVRVSFTVRFDDSPEGRQAQALVERVVQVSHDKDCTVSRTVQHPTNVTFTA